VHLGRDDDNSSQARVRSSSAATQEKEVKAPEVKRSWWKKKEKAPKHQNASSDKNNNNSKSAGVGGFSSAAPSDDTPTKKERMGAPSPVIGIGRGKMKRGSLNSNFGGGGAGGNLGSPRSPGSRRSSNINNSRSTTSNMQHNAINLRKSIVCLLELEQAASSSGSNEPFGLATASAPLASRLVEVSAFETTVSSANQIKSMLLCVFLYAHTCFHMR
jgi:hypothetical protein